MKILTVIIIIALLAAFAGCDGSRSEYIEEPRRERRTSAPETTDTTSAAISDDICISETKIYAVFSLLNTETFSYSLVLEIDNQPLKIEMFRNGDDFYANLLNGSTEMLVVDWKHYSFDHEAKIAYESDLSRTQFDELLKRFDGADYSMLDLSEAKLIDTGIADFMGQKREYEEIRDKFGNVHRVFFAEDILVGLKSMNNDGEWIEIAWFISGTVDEGVFKIPLDYQIIRR
jgi:hypothetical protein